MSEPTSDASDLEPEPQTLRVHSEDPAEGADPDDAAEAGAEHDVPRVHGQDTAEG